MTHAAWQHRPYPAPRHHTTAGCRHLAERSVEIEVPDDIAALAIDAGGEIRFELGFGLEELLQGWPTITKKVM